MEIAAPDQRHVGFDPAEGVGFVHKAGGQNARHSSSPQLQRRQLRVPEAINDMVIDHPSRLHKSVANRRPYELEAALSQILAHRIRFFGGAWNVAHTLPCILHRCVIDELPNIGVEAAKMPLHLDKSFGIHDGVFDLQSVAYDSGIGEQFSELPLSVSRDLAWLDIVKGAAVALALSQYGDPAQPCLRAFENEQLEQSSIIVERATPFTVVVGDVKRVIGCPSAPLNSHHTRRLYSLGQDSYAIGTRRLASSASLICRPRSGPVGRWNRPSAGLGGFSKTECWRGIVSFHSQGFVIYSRLATRWGLAVWPIVGCVWCGTNSTLLCLRHGGTTRHMPVTPA